MSTDKISFIVYGEPKGKARPRFKRLGKFTLTYTPKESVEYENRVRKAFIVAAKKTKFKKLEGPVEVETESIFKIPASYSKKKKAELIGKPATRKPDTDNIIKSVLDPLNGIAYEDDCQVCKVTGYKYYGLEPRVEITIKPFKQIIKPFRFVDKNEKIEY